MSGCPSPRSAPDNRSFEEHPGALVTCGSNVLLWGARRSLRSVLDIRSCGAAATFVPWPVATVLTRVIRMWRLAVTGLLVLHGILHAAIWLPPQQGSDLPNFGAQASWLFAEVRPVVVTLALIAASGFVLSGVAYLAHLDTWAISATIAVVASMALIVATFTPWWSFAVVINGLLLYAAWQSATAPLVSR